MTGTAKYRLCLLVAWILAGGFCGAWSGYYVARVQAEDEAKRQAVDAATRAETLIASMMTESRTLLSAFNAADLPACSSAEIGLLRRRVFEARNLRDAGRIANGQMQCSALFGAGDFTKGPIQPTIRAADGFSFYRNVAPYSTGGPSIYVVQKGNFYVVLDPGVLRQLWEFRVNVEATTIDAVTGKRVRPSGAPLVGEAMVLDRDWTGRANDTLYVTRCTADVSMCSTAYEALSTLLHADRRRMAMGAAVGFLLGVFPVLCGSVVLQFRQATASQLLRSIRRERIAVVYQPIVELKTRRVIGAEALARWTDEDGIPVSPAAFVHMAEQRGFIGELTELVLRRAVQDFRAVLLSPRHFQLNVNVTATDLEDAQFIVRLEDLLRGIGIPPARIAFEVTEGTTANKPRAMEAIHELRRRGHRIEIDDFGTGYSNLAYLNSFPVDAIKIDQSFTRTLDAGGPAADIVPQILSIARALNLEVIVEGIESPGQAEYFARFEWTIYGQGWLFGRPVSAEGFHRLWLGAESQWAQAVDGVDFAAQ